MKTKIKKLLSSVLYMSLGGFLVFTSTFAFLVFASSNTSWIKSGSVLNASNLKSNLDYLLARTTDNNNNKVIDKTDDSSRVNGLSAADLQASSAGGDKNYKVVMLDGNAYCPSGWDKFYFSKGAFVSTDKNGIIGVQTYNTDKYAIWAGHNTEKGLAGEINMGFYSKPNVAVTVCISN
jgi:hypothetical protein